MFMYHEAVRRMKVHRANMRELGVPLPALIEDRIYGTTDTRGPERVLRKPKAMSNSEYAYRQQMAAPPNVSPAALLPRAYGRSAKPWLLSDEPSSSSSSSAGAGSASSSSGSSNSNSSASARASSSNSSQSPPTTRRTRSSR